MARFTCDTCNEAVFKSRLQAFNHLANDHNIPLLSRSDWHGREWYRKQTYSSARYYCQEHHANLWNIVMLLKHCSMHHNVCMWYVRGLSKKRVYLDGLITDVVET